jgi:DNA-directed RNA polymerase subunit alpha
VTAADITPHQDVEIINPDLVIATLTKDVRFVLELDVGAGRGFVPAESQRIDGAPVGTIAIDSIYSPVQRVSFNVATCRLGKRTDYEALDLEIWTDGSITPELALVEATNILRKHLNPFVKYFEMGRDLEVSATGDMVIEGDLERTAMLAKQITALDLSVRTENALRAANIKVMGDLVVMDESEVAGIRNLSKLAIKEIKKKLSDRGMSFGMRLTQKTGA